MAYPGLQGRRCLVAAGSAGLGLATARALLEQGAAVAICGRSPERLEHAAASLPGDVVTVVADLARGGGATRFAEVAAEALGGPAEVVVANAGGPPPGSATGTDLAAYTAALELNFLSTVELVRATVEPMRAAGWGRIVAVTSVGARQPIPDLAASSAARAATTSFIKNLATEVAPDGVTANTVQPGAHDTERMRELGGAHLDATLAGIPAGRMGRPEDFGALVAFLCSDHARFICGAAIPVDGGASRGLQ